MNRVRLGGSPRSGVVLTGPTTSITGPITYQMLATDSSIRVTSGPATINLATAATGVQDGALVYIVSFDASGNLITINAAGGDNINGGPTLGLSEYGAYVVLKARNSGGVTNWTIYSTNPFDRYPFPLNPTLVAGAQGPLSMGYAMVPQGVRYLKLAYFGLDAIVGAGTVTILVHGLQNDPQTLTIVNPNSAVAQINSPGNNNWKTLPNLVPLADGTRVQATVSTNAAFTGPTTVFGGLEFWS
jgi:hypothetical protein